MTTLADALILLAPEHPIAHRVAATHAQDCRVEPDCVVVQGTVRGPGTVREPCLELELDLPELLLCTMRGGRWESTYPVEAFAPRERLVHPRHLPDRNFQRGAPGFGTESFGSIGGRSSDGDMPYFLLADPDGDGGLWVAVGWSGGWQATVQRTSTAGGFIVYVEGPGAGVELGDGEALTLPPMYVGAYQGDGWEAIRGFLKRRARPGLPLVVYDTWFNEEVRMTDERLRAHVPAAAEVGIEVFVVDAGWYETGTPPDAPGSDWYAATGSGVDHVGIGTWMPDPLRFPDGMEGLSQAVRDAGMRFGIWFEPERAHVGSWVATERPSWVRSSPRSQFRLVDFGHPEARAWALENMSDAIARWHVGWLRWDMNFKAVSVFWEDDPRAELEHVYGVWAVMDELKRRHPDCLLEGCASGGNRLDAEMLMRSDTYWSSDSAGSPDIVRAQIRNARRLLPVQYCGVSFTPHVAPLDDWPDEWWLAPMSGTPVIMDRPCTWSPALRERARRHIDAFKGYRHLLDSRYRILANGDRPPLRSWDAWEFSDEATGEAVLIAFRQRAPEAVRELAGARRWSVQLPQNGAGAWYWAPTETRRADP